MPLWDDATAPFTQQPQMPDDGSLLSHLYRLLGSPGGAASMFPAADPSQGQSMFSAEPQPITQSVDPSIQPTLALRDPERQQQAMDIALSFGPGAIRAFHGSPHDFPAFDINKIGTGEGAQAYGRGLYFAENEGVARSYRDALSPAPPVSIDTRPSFVKDGNPWFPENTGGQLGYMRTRLAQIVPHDSYATPEHITQVFDELRDHYNNLKGPLRDVNLNGLQTLGESFKADEPQFFNPKPPPPSGRMYQVNLNAEPEHLLDWDKPLSEQPQKIKDILDANVQKWSSPGDVPTADWMKQYQAGTLPGRMVYRALGRGSDEAATAAWREAGVPGIRYLDRLSRGAGQGSSNYVMFDDKLIDILRKYAVPGLLGGGAAAGAATGDQ